MRRFVLLLVGVLALVACGSGTGAGAGGADVEGEWQLRSGTTDGTAIPQPDGPGATLDVSGDRASGTAFCNHWFATVRADGPGFALEGIGSTEMACRPDVMAAERAYLTALAAVDTATVDGEELVLTGEGVDLRFEPVTPVPEEELLGTRWTLESLVDGGTASSTVGGPATLELSADGSLTGSTGCRELSGRFTVEGDVVRATELSAGTGDCPAEVEAQDAHVVAVLGDGFRVSVEGDRLTLTAPDGRGLVYRAS